MTPGSAPKNAVPHVQAPAVASSLPASQAENAALVRAKGADREAAWSKATVPADVRAPPVVLPKANMRLWCMAMTDSSGAVALDHAATSRASPEDFRSTAMASAP